MKRPSGYQSSKGLGTGLFVGRARGFFEDRKNRCLLCRKAHRHMTQACRRKAVTEESQRSKKVFSAMGPWVVLTFLLWGHVADIHARHEPELDALNRRKTVAQR